MESPTIALREYDHISRVFQFCQQMRIESSGILKELTDQSIASTKTKRYAFLLRFRYENLEVQAAGRGITKKKAKSEACKNGLIQLVHHLKLDNPVLRSVDYGVTEVELADYRPPNSLNARANPSAASFDRSTNSVGQTKREAEWQPKAVSKLKFESSQPVSNSKAPINQWTPPSPAVSPNRRDGNKWSVVEKENAPTNRTTDSNGQTLSSRPAGYFAKPPSTNGFQRAKPAASEIETRATPAASGIETRVTPNSGKAKIDRQPSSTNGVVGQTVAKTGGQESKNQSSSTQIHLDLNEMAIELKKLKNGSASSADQNAGNHKTVMDAVAYLKKNQDAFKEIDELQKNTTMSYTRLILRLTKLMPKLKHEFRLSGQGDLGISQLFYEDLCLHTVFCSSEPSTCPDTAPTFEEDCAKKIYFVLKLNYLAPRI